MLRTIVAPSVAWLAAGILLAPAACKEPNPAFDGPAGASSSGSESSTTATTPTTDPMPMTTSGMDGTSSTSLPVDDTTSDTMPPDTSSSGTPETTTEGSSSSGGEEQLYPPCMLDEDPMCERPYEVCYDFLAPEYSVCTLPCEQDEDCPAPASGEAPAICAGQMDDQCVLDCADGATCPDGMECQVVVMGMVERCLWPS
jgi:hypothetical protein